MNDKEFLATIFWVSSSVLLGIFVGISIFGTIQIGLGFSPKQITEKWEIEVIKRGYAEMVVVDDKLEFKWKDDLTKTKSEVE